jgi:hypothetical protein
VGDRSGAEGVRIERPLTQQMEESAVKVGSVDALVLECDDSQSLRSLRLNSP